VEEQLRVQMEYLQGLVAGLQAAVRGLILAHPDPSHAAAVVGLLLEETHAHGLASPSATDTMLHGLEMSPSRLVPTDDQLERSCQLGR